MASKRKWNLFGLRDLCWKSRDPQPCVRHGKRKGILVRRSWKVVGVFSGFTVKRGLQYRCSNVWRYKIRHLQLLTQSLQSMVGDAITKIYTFTKQDIRLHLEGISKWATMHALSIYPRILRKEIKISHRSGLPYK